MVYPNEYIKFLIHFHGDRDYFECHEVLEEFWKETEPSNRFSIWVGFIQLAVALYHHRRGNFKGALKLLSKSTNILKQKRMEIIKLGINSDDLYSLLDQFQINLKNGYAYRSMDLPIFEPTLLKICKTECKKMSLEWCGRDIEDRYIVHRHILRDRTDVEIDRILAKILKNTNRINKISLK